jgi:hypothetical protein
VFFSFLKCKTTRKDSRGSGGITVTTYAPTPPKKKEEKKKEEKKKEEKNKKS